MNSLSLKILTVRQRSNNEHFVYVKFALADEGEVIEDDSDGSIEDQPKVKVMMAPEAEEATGSSDDVTVEVRATLTLHDL